ncbi:hypothetical protein PI124_g23061 [Phytophthora idaei]|nr:hypothetical protein PI125_g24952 [Phytophthora idaei]KAG3126651.1 hypothetical protein PI126_g22229 [Phytophthora idaei]KAG3231845.1 hypothetical protein PI124_g23061 [Phytophthora idaei]
MISRRLHDANWSHMSKRRFDAILADNDRENDQRLEHFYQPGDHVMIRVPKQFRAKIKRMRVDRTRFKLFTTMVQSP